MKNYILLMKNKPHNSKSKEEERKVEISDQPPLLFHKVIEILEYTKLCNECLGRQFSFLATATNNSERANALLMSITMECHKILLKNSIDKKYTLLDKDPIDILILIANQTSFKIAKKILEKWKIAHPDTDYKIDDIMESEKCDMCEGLLLTKSIDSLVKKIEILSKVYDFSNFLVGTYLNKKLADKEDEFRFKFKLINGESFKANLNRVIGKKLQSIWDKPTKFEKPDINIMIDLRESEVIKVNFHPKSLYISGKYKKLVRNLPQTHWHCSNCRGRGYIRKSDELCNECKGTGDTFDSSVEDLIGIEIIKISDGKSAILHGAGREDLDVRCLGTGRPFVIEIKMPKKRDIELNELTSRINSKHGKEIFVSELSFSSKQVIVSLKKNSEEKKKKYHALVYLDEPINNEEFKIKLEFLKNTLNGKKIKQRTPTRVVHRRTDKTREKKIYNIEGKYIDPCHILFKIQTQGGTYIKELISSDNFRTSPSFSQLFRISMKCVELDVVQIED